jgi:hypothetical protein
MTDPEIVMIAGDWHGNRRWAIETCWRARKLPEPRIILQLGDFGFWPYPVKDWAPGDRRPAALQYLRDIEAALDLSDAEIWVTPGNHDDYDQINSWPWEGRSRILVPGFNRIHCLARGAEWEWHEKRWLSVGGAVSVDRLWPLPGRVNHVNWWPGEEVTDEEVARIAEGDPVDVMIAHDWPAMVRYTHDHHLGPTWHPQDLQRGEVHHRRLQVIVDARQPKFYMHGHLHQSAGRTYDFGYGPVQVACMDMDGEPGNFKALNVRTMEWE